MFNSSANVSTWRYLDWEESSGYAWIVQFFYLILLHSQFVPVSLYVSMAMVRFFQAYFMVSDLEMYYEKLDIPMLVSKIIFASARTYILSIVALEGYFRCFLYYAVDR